LQNFFAFLANNITFAAYFYEEHATKTKHACRFAAYFSHGLYVLRNEILATKNTSTKRKQVKENMASPRVMRKLMDEEKYKLIEFYRNNPELWSTNQGITRAQKLLKKDELVKEFGGKFQIEWLEKMFHSLRASFLREYKINKDKNCTKRPWKFYKSMLFLKEHHVTVKKTDFSIEEREVLITFYQHNPELWNYRLEGCSDQNVRRSLIQKLVKKFDDKFTERDIKWEWSSLLSRYTREKQIKFTARPTEACADDISCSSWEYFDRMAFVDVTSKQADYSMNTLEQDDDLTPQVTKRIKLSEENDVAEHKTALWIALAPPHTSQAAFAADSPNTETALASNSPNNETALAAANSPNTETTKKSNEYTTPPPHNNNLVERANLFGSIVADNLLQCDPRDWTFLKKKIFDLFYEYEQGSLQ